MKHFRQPRYAISREATMESSVPPKPSASKPRLRGSRMSPRRTLEFEAIASDLSRQVEEPTSAATAVIGTSESGLQVVAQMKPPRKDKDEEEMIVQKLSNDSLTSKGQTFTFDSVAFLDEKMSSDQQGTNQEC